ncbi:hypothetical protein EJB05_55170, partial [Eragrostis curvula]
MKAAAEEGNRQLRRVAAVEVHCRVPSSVVAADPRWLCRSTPDRGDPCAPHSRFVQSPSTSLPSSTTDSLLPSRFDPPEPHAEQQCKRGHRPLDLQSLFVEVTAASGDRGKSVDSLSKKTHWSFRLTYHYKNCIHQAARTRYNMLQLLLSSLGLSLLSYLFILYECIPVISCSFLLTCGSSVVRSSILGVQDWFVSARSPSQHVSYNFAGLR